MVRPQDPDAYDTPISFWSMETVKQDLEKLADLASKESGCDITFSAYCRGVLIRHIREMKERGILQ